MALSFAYPVWNAVNIDRASGAPLHEQLFAQLRAAIASGRIARGSRLPPSRQFAAEIGVSRNTIVTVYDRLTAEGYIRQRVGAGTYVETVVPEDHQPKAAGPAGWARTSTMALSRRGGQIVRTSMPGDRLDQFDLSPGVPALDEFPFDTFARLAGRYWRGEPTVDLGYGKPGGLRDLRQQIAQYLGEARGVICEPDQVIVLNGTRQAITLIGELLLDPGDGVVVEDPSPVSELATLAATGARPISVPIDREGLDIKAAEGVRHARLAAVTPIAQFPFGSDMSIDRRRNLLAWAEANDSWILEDDFNSEIRWAGQPLPPLATLDRKGHVLYASSFNRVLAPGLRLAYLIVPLDLVDAFTAAQQTLAAHVALPMQHLVAEFMAEGRLASHLRRMRAIYCERAGILADALRSRLGGAFEVPEVTAGLHLTAISREAIDDLAVSNAALRYRLDVPPLSRYCSPTRRLTGFILGFGNTRPSRIPRCVETLARVIEATAGRPLARLQLAAAPIPDRISRTSA